MTTESHRLKVGGLEIEVRRKAIKNLHVGVYPPDGKVRVAAPLRLDAEAIRLAVISRLPWIRRQKASLQAQERHSEREMVTGECHYVDGIPHRLDLVERDAPARVRLSGSRTLELQVRPGTDRDKRDAILREWYRQRLRQQLRNLVPAWQKRTGVSVKEVGIKKMKTLWGSCNPEAGRIWLNLELAKKPPSCVEFILVHEMTHMLERNHTARFEGLMDSYLPNWRSARDRLNQLPLGHESWEY